MDLPKGKNCNKKGPKLNIFKVYLICLISTKAYRVDKLLSLNSFPVKRKKQYLASEQHLLPRKNITGCLPGNAVQGFFVRIFSLDLVYFYNAIVRF